MGITYNAGLNTIDFDNQIGGEAIARDSFVAAGGGQTWAATFQITRNPLVLRIGTTAGAQDILPDTVLPPGDHQIVVPLATGGTRYFEFRLRNVGKAQLSGFDLVVNGTAGGNHKFTTPYAEADIPSVRYAQSLNSLFMAGGNKPPQVFERRGTNSWSWREFQPLDGPFQPLNLSTVTMTPSDRIGEVTITASSPVFRQEHEGTLIKTIHPGQYTFESIAGAELVTDSIRVTGVSTARTLYYDITIGGTATVVLEQSIGTPYNWTTVATINASTAGWVSYLDGLDNQIVYYRLRCSAYTSGTVLGSLGFSVGYEEGIARIHSVDSDVQVTVDVIEQLGQPEATTLWALSEWSDERGWPTAVELHDGRLWYGRGIEYWASRSDNFASFSIGAEADDAIGRTLSGRASAIRWLASLGQLAVGGAGAEYQIMSNTFSDVIVPANVQSKQRMTKGSADHQPVRVDDAVIAISRSLKRLYRIGSSDDFGTLTANDLTRLHREIAGQGFVELAWQQEPEPRIWGVRSDGQVAVLVYDVEERVFAWWRVNLSGAVESMCILPSAAGNEDDVYFVIRRQLSDLSYIRQIEKMKPENWTDLQEAWSLEGAIEGTHASATQMGLPDAFDDATDIYMWHNSRQYGPYTADGTGIIQFGETLTGPYAVGRKITGTYKSPRLNWGAQSGGHIAQYRKPEKLKMMLKNTAGGCMTWGTDLTKMTRIEDRNLTSDDPLSWDSAVQLWNADIERQIAGMKGRDSRLFIQMDQVGPCTVLGVQIEQQMNA